VTASTDRGFRVVSKWVVLAAGYESLPWLNRKPRIELTNTFALATEPLIEHSGCLADHLLWETARPYCYVRPADDRRAIIGGEDVPFEDCDLRERCLAEKVARLARRWEQWFPHQPLEIACSWAGTFANTEDGLPYIGFPPDQARSFFALCYGGNGIVYGVVAAELLLAALRGERHPCSKIFRFLRGA
jgi:glycine/D-amino acid oxidase-like deaminating enzyme